MDPSGSIRVGRKELRNKEEQGQVIRAEAESLLLRSIRFIGPHFPLFLCPRLSLFLVIILLSSSSISFVPCFRPDDSPR